MKLRITSLALFVLFTCFWAQADANGAPAGTRAYRDAASSSRLPETTLLGNELQQSNATLTSLSARTGRLKNTVESARTEVDSASTMIRGIDKIDDLLIRVIRDITPVSKLPPTRTLRPLAENLAKLQKQVHKVRVKGDDLQKKFLKPLHSRLKSLENKLKTAIADMDTGARKADQARKHLETLRDFVKSHNNQATVAALESLSQRTRAGIRPLNAGLKSLDDASRAAENELNGLTKDLSSLTASAPAVQKLQKDLNPVDKASRDLDKVLNQHVGVKVLGKDYGFTVRQVIEGPGKLLDIVLKPLEKLADKALKPILHSLKLEIKPPRKLEATEHSLDEVAKRQTTVTQSVAHLESALQGTGSAAFRKSLDELSGTSTSKLGHNL